MKLLALADLKDLNEYQVKQHLVREYGAVSNDPEVSKALENFEVLVAYESVGDYGCDSSSYFLLKSKQSGNLFVVTGGHCSCYGFENQFTPSETTVEALKHQANNGYFFSTGGYDSNADDNTKAVKDYINNL